MGNLIVKDNALIEASHKLSEAEQRLILLAILKAREKGNSIELLKDKELIIHANDYIKYFRVDRDTAYWALKKAVMGLYRAEWGYKYINEKGNKVVRYERFTQSAEYIEGEGLVKFMFANAIIPLLVELEKRFTIYEIEQISNLSSSYAMRLYEFFMQHLDKKTGKGWLEISLEELRFRFGLLPTEYEKMGNFKTRVLDFSLKQINEYTDLIASYEQKKQGRKITGFKFNFKYKAKPKPKKPKNTVKSPQSPDLFEGLSKEECTVITRQVNDYIKHLELRSGEKVSPFHHENIIKKATSERWGIAEFEEKKQRQQARKAEQKRIAQEEKIQKDAENEKNKQLALYFENLSVEQQRELIKKVGKKLPPILKNSFDQLVEKGEAHTSPKFRHLIYQAIQEDF